MNSYVSDPGLLVFIALVACIHATVLIARRMGGQARGDQVGVGFIVLVAFGLVLYLKLAKPDAMRWFAPSMFVVLVPLLCGLYLGGRAKQMEHAIGIFCLAMVASYLLTRWSMGMTPATFDKTSEADAPFTMAAKGVASMKGPLSPGFINPADVPGVRDLGVKDWRPAWHTFITGVPAARVSPYRIWTPGGDPAVAASKLRLVLAGDPEPSLSASGTKRLSQR